MKRIFAGSLLALLSLAVEGQAQTIVPFRLEGGHLVVVQGSIGWLGNLNLVIDTGASTTVISRWVARQLRLKGRPAQAVAFNRPVDLEEVVSDISLGGRRFEAASVRVGSLEFGDLTAPVRIDALIGLDLLRQTGLVIDYSAETLSFGPVVHCGSTVPFYNKLPFIPVSMTVRGRRLSLLLDTGFADLTLFARATEDRLAFRRTAEVTEIRSAGGRRSLEKVVLREVRMGEREWQELPAYLLDGAAPMERLDGVLGVACLRLTRLCVDFEKGLLSWQTRGARP